MSVFKYMSAEGGLRFLRGWELRITPPQEFNDPFELRPPSGEMFTSDYVDKEFRDAAPQMILEDLTKQLKPTLHGVLNEEEVRQLITCILPGTSSSLEKRVRRTIVPKVRALAGGKFEAIQRTTRAAYPLMLEQARIAASLLVPRVNSIVQQSFSKAPAMVGVLCLSRNANQPLMWAHYADSHRGVLIEFDESHAAFNRRRSTEDDFGYLRPVVYSELRPKLSINEFDKDNAFEVFALTKSHHWGYEEESRFLWPLQGADRTVESPSGSIALVQCPPDAVRSIILGCKSSGETIEQVRQALDRDSAARRIEVRQARMDDTAFELTYGPVSAASPHIE